MFECHTIVSLAVCIFLHLLYKMHHYRFLLKTVVLVVNEGLFTLLCIWIRCSLITCSDFGEEVKHTKHQTVMVTFSEQPFVKTLHTYRVFGMPCQTEPQPQLVQVNKRIRITKHVGSTRRSCAAYKLTS